MLELHYSNRLEALIGPLAGRVRAAQRSDPLRPVHVLVPNRAMAQFVRFQLAQAVGIAANLRFEYLEPWLAELARAADPALRVLTHGELQMLLIRRLRRAADDPALAPVRRYLRGEDGAPGPATYQLARQLAGLFTAYAEARPDMVDAWPARATLPLDSPYAGTEAWQRALWCALFDAEGAARVEGDDDGLRRMLLPQALDRLPDEALALPPAVHLFGHSYLPPALTPILARIGQLTHVCLYVLNPCLEFWEDVEAGGWVVSRDRLVRREDRRRIEGDDPFGLGEAEDTAALRLWGRPGREHVRLLNALTECSFSPSFVDPGEGSLLRRLQRDILLRAPRPDGPPGPPDDSIRLLACPSIGREAEIVANEIWSLVQADPALRFHEIAVIVADAQRDAYLTHVEAAFTRLHGIPFEVIDRRLAGVSRVAEAVEALLELPRGPFSRGDVLRFLTNPAVAGDEDDAERWRAWAADLHVVFGADRSDLADTYFDRDVFHWDQALRRLALGAFMTGERSGDDRVHELGGARRLVHEIAPDGLPALGRLLAKMRALIADVRRLRDAILPLREWAAVLADLVRRHVQPRRGEDGPADERALAEIHDALAGLAALDLEDEPLPYPVAHAFARDAVTGLEAVRGRYLAEGVAVSSLLPMRAIPFKVIFVLGLGEGRFPAIQRESPLDLRQARRRAGDVGAAERDRYVFLETLLSARERLYLSWVSRNPHTGDPLEPSTVVRELQFVLRGYVTPEGLDAMVVAHPVSASDPRYFEPGGALASVDPAARRAARARALREHLLAHLRTAGVPPDLETLRAAVDPALRARLDASLRLPPPVPPPAKNDDEARISLPLYAIRAFLESPLQGSARFLLGLREDDDGDDAAEGDEPLTLGRRLTNRLLRDAFWRGARDGRPDEWLRRLFERLALAGATPLGPFADRALRTGGEVLDAWRASARILGLDDLASWQKVRVGRADEGAEVDRLLPPIVLDIELPTGPARVELHGGLEPLSAGADASLRCLVRDKVKDKDFLPGILSAVAWAAAGEDPPGEHRLLLATSAAKPNPKKQRRIFHPFTPAEARAYLAGLVTELLSRVHGYLLPIEAVFGYVAGKKPSPSEAVRELTERESGWSCAYGPVRDPGRFEPPDDDEAERIIERRYRPLFDRLVAEEDGDG